jgi:hypothetical protein
MRKTLEPQVRSASTRFTNRFRSEANLRTRQRSRRRAVAERALRRNLRPAGHFSVLPGHTPDPSLQHRFRGTSAGIQNVSEADRSNALPPSALQRRSVTSAVSVCHHLALGTGFEPATARLRVWCSIQAELTGIGDDRLEPMSGTQRANPRFRDERISELPAPLDSRHQRSLLSKRRRWESNPHKAALQAAAFPSGSDVGLLSTHKKCPRQDSNLVFDLRRVACDPPHSEDDRKILGDQYPAEDSNLVRQFRRLPCVPAHPQGVYRLRLERHPTAGASLLFQMSRPGFEPGPGPSEGPNAIRYTIETLSHTHQSEQGRRVDSHHHHPVYKTGAFLSRATSAIARNNTARARGVEPRKAVLEAAGSPGSTLV